MQTELNQVANLALFAKIVQSGGISRCALDLGMERTTVSRRLGDLERNLGVKLLDRSPSHMAVTEAGRLCFERCEHLLKAAKDAQAAAINGRAVVNAEPITVGAPPDIIEHNLSSQLIQFEDANPEISIRCYPVSRWVAATFSTMDLVIAWDAPRTSEVTIRQLAEIEQSIYASPDYLARNGFLGGPQDISDHTCIVDGPVPKNLVWSFKHESDSSRVLIKRRVEVTNMLDARAATVAGLGLCCLPNYLCEREVKKGRLVALLPDYSTNPRSLLLICPRQGVDKPRATALCLYLEDAYRPPLESRAGSRLETDD